MPVKVRFLSKEVIAGSADQLLEDYSREHGVVREPPVPVEEILELHLRLSFGFANLRRDLGVPDVLGALWVEDREVRVDEQLDPDVHQGVEGRYRFTLAHEIGHWQLHRDALSKTQQADLPGGMRERPSVVCRSSEAKAPIEWQADRFAADLLMPERMVREQWTRAKGNAAPLAYQDFQHTQYARRPPSRGLTRIGLVALRSIEAEHTYFFEQVARQFAPRFGVSILAMRIRLEELGLLRVNREPARLFQ